MTESRSSVTFPALGSTAFVAVADPRRLGDGRAAVDATIAEFDVTCSRFRDDSELMALNAAAGSPVRVSPLLLDAVKAAVRAAQLTDGDVDPTIGAALIALGYDRDFAALPAVGWETLPAASPTAAPPRPVTSLVPVPGWRTIQIDEHRRTVRLSRGVTLDLGATAKALAADRAAATAHRATDCGVLVGIGGDFAIAGEAPRDGWRIRVTDDHRFGPEMPGQWIALHSGGLATSSTTVRRWRGRSGPVHHLLDPATAIPVDGMWRTASVTARTCLDANIASTAAIIRGERAVPWLEELAMPARLVARDGTVKHVAGWPADGDDLAGSREGGPS